MSFDFFVCPISTWDERARTTLIEILYRDAISTDDYEKVAYADGSRALDISGLDDWDRRQTSSLGLCFRRFGGKTMMHRIYEIADRLDAMMFWPGDPPYVAVTRQDLFDRLPAKLDRACAVVVRDADHLSACITG